MQTRLDSPLKVETTAPVRWEEPSLDKVKLVVILEEQSRPVPIPGWSPHGLPQVSQLCQRLVIVGPVLVVVALYQLPEHVLQLQLLRLLQTEGDHRHCWLVAFLLSLVHLQYSRCRKPTKFSLFTSTLEFNSANCSFSSCRFELTKLSSRATVSLVFLSVEALKQGGCYMPS